MSARQHGIRNDDMIHAFNHPILVENLDDGFTMFVGADTAGNLLESVSSTPPTDRSLFPPCLLDRNT